MLRKVVNNSFGGTATPANWNLTVDPDRHPAAGRRSPDRHRVGRRSDHPGPTRTELLPDREHRYPGGLPAPVDRLQRHPGERASPSRSVRPSPARSPTATCSPRSRWSRPSTTTTARHGGADGVDVVGDRTDHDHGCDGLGPVTNAPVNAGTYTLVRVAVQPATRRRRLVLHRAGTLTGASLVLPVGDRRDLHDQQHTIRPTLTLVKTVTNNNGGTAVPTAWTLSAAGPTTITGPPARPAVTNATVNAGTYTLSESRTGRATPPAPGPAPAAPSPACSPDRCSQRGQNATCTINNNDQPATLTLVKTVTNDNGGTAVPTAWTLTATGPTTITGTHRVRCGDRRDSQRRYLRPVRVERTGRLHGRSVVVHRPAPSPGSSLVLPVGVSATCTINNNDQPAHPHAGEDGRPTDQRRHAPSRPLGRSPPPVPPRSPAPPAPPPVTNAPVSAGAYTLSESGDPPGYAPGPWSCIGGTLDRRHAHADSRARAPPARSTTPTVAPRLTLVKTVTNDNGGTAVPTDWTLTATGPTVDHRRRRAPTVRSRTGSVQRRHLHVVRDRADAATPLECVARVRRAATPSASVARRAG